MRGEDLGLRRPLNTLRGGSGVGTALPESKGGCDPLGGSVAHPCNAPAGEVRAGFGHGFQVRAPGPSPPPASPPSLASREEARGEGRENGVRHRAESFVRLKSARWG